MQQRKVYAWAGPWVLLAGWLELCAGWAVATEKNLEGKAPAGRRPNVLWIMTDQHRADFMTCAGNRLVPTPNLDRIAARGVRFLHAYCTDPICAPSRMSLMTGLYPYHHGVLNNQDQLDWRVRTVAHEFAQRGYHTALLGKMHFNGGSLHGFDYFVSINDWLMYLGPKVPLFVNEIANDPFSGPNVFRTVYDDGSGLPEIKGVWPKGSPWVGKVERYDFRSTVSKLDAEDHLDAFLAREAVKFLKNHRDQPFFLVVGFMKPHAPFYPPRQWAERYPPDKVQLPPVGDTSTYPKHLRARIAYIQGFGERRLRALRAGYLGNLAFVDTQIGEVYQALEKENLVDNTIVIYTSDHGEMAGDHGLYEKMCMFEPSVAVPLIVSYPGHLPEGKVAKGIVENMGIYPTLMELLGWDIPEDIDARSFARALTDPDCETQPAAFAQFNPWPKAVGEYMIRTPKYKYIYNVGSTPELYDEQADPGEFVNLAGRPEFKKIEDDLRSQLFRWHDPRRSANIKGSTK
ncbi:MAG: sulfatase-like hydrolase/transferase [Planctomycetes bacterium]|nr:sulfatase-like hydrolase/transferase [Planctomycetota bacterium]